MKNHEWFKMDLNQDNFFPDESALKNKLFKYVSVRNEGRQKNDKGADDDDDWINNIKLMEYTPKIF